MVLKTGMRLRSQIDATELIVVKPPAGEELLLCGGHPMVELGRDLAEGLVAEPGAGTQIGKRYTSSADASFEVLVTRAGASDLKLGEVTLVRKEAKPLPASD